MKTSLNLSIDEDLAQRAKEEAERRGTSVSQMVEAFFASLDAQTGSSVPDDYTPSQRIRSLRSSLQSPERTPLNGTKSVSSKSSNRKTPDHSCASFLIPTFYSTPFWNDNTPRRRTSCSIKRWKVQSTVTSTILINTFYVGRKEVGRDSATRFVRELLEDVTILPVSGAMLRRAIRRYEDFEDGAIGEAAEASDVDTICTRNETDFQSSNVPVLSPRALIRTLHSS